MPGFADFAGFAGVVENKRVFILERFSYDPEKQIPCAFAIVFELRTHFPLRTRDVAPNMETALFRRPIKNN